MGTLPAASVPVWLNRSEHERAHAACHASALLWNLLVGWVRAEWEAGRSPGREGVADHEEAAPAGTRVVVRLVVGDVRGIERGTRKRRHASRSTRRQLSQWERGTQERQLAYKTGLMIRHICEAYSSQTCPYCLTRRKVRGRSYVCVNKDCGSVLHRDAVGGVNIHALAVNDGTIVPVPPEVVIRVKYLRAQPGWSVGQRECH
ncbi:transposase [Streptomyces sp. HU2014]|uniref:transposase n=1 Tax=Streptomyces sp. HU2014 TaxID=2939414 RepID=UPI00200F7E9B|nr:transposase [Streptomyces sp. HU2014]UQI49042.1 transposase [Streptomyces sp. HU2014]